ncbi:MAG: gliding motility-associated C-terminal domain-containing protein [Bacteroidales bacterium]|nr:gliding motility-associated C-terminal domain-containing protein [Bacteroidales bacterium]
MKKSLAVLSFMAAMLAFGVGWSQTIVRVDSVRNGTTINLGGSGVELHDDDSQGEGAPTAGSYKKGIDYWVTLAGGCSDPLRMVVRVDELQVSCLDTVYIYEGNGTGGPLLAKFNSFSGGVGVGDLIMESPTNATGMITVRLVTDDRTDSTRTSLSCYQNYPNLDKGFKFSVYCMSPCESVVPVIEDKFYRTRNGVIYDSAYIHEITIIDTFYVVPDDPTSGIDYINENTFIGANLCIGDGVIFNGRGEYSNKFGYYMASDATTYFRWDLGNEGDSIVGFGATQITYEDYQSTGCFDVRLDLVDEFGCRSTQNSIIRVRTAMNPIKSIFTLDDMCNRDSMVVNMGYGEGDAVLTLARIQSDSSVSKTFSVRTFIPDGCGCPAGNYFEAPVTFTEFPNSKKVTSAADICSICINMEHSYMADIAIAIVCPEDSIAYLKYGRSTSCPRPDRMPAKPSGSAGSADCYKEGTGIRLGASLTGNYDVNSSLCDSLANPYGIGMDYCFSRDTNYTLVTGERAGDVWDATNLHPNGDFNIGKNAKIDPTPVVFPAVPSPFYAAGSMPNALTLNIKRPSDHDNRTDYYLPYATFDELVGCSLNGEWKIRVYDMMGKDNGWIFSWTLDICNVSANGCDYQVDIDSILWVPDPDPMYHDYDLGHYRGAEVHEKTPIISHVLTPDTAGTFPILVHIYDEFGCQWDTSTVITTHWTPKPDLGPDTALCGIDRMVLDASDDHAASQNYSYGWLPTGESTPTIETRQDPGEDITYVVEVQNKTKRVTCVTRDTITVGTRQQPLPNIIPDPFVFEGCDPFTIHFENNTVNGDIHRWYFGDGATSSEASPTHTYNVGTFDLRYYVYSGDGCVDSIISPQSISVFPSPKASFSWAPTYPSVTDPMLSLTNLTSPKSANTNYFWEVQYNLDNPFSVETMTEESPVFDITQYFPDNPAGNYSIRLISRSDNLAPSGNMIYCADTSENTILVVNDFLQFPNVVTPNGDGVNDRFEVKNLIEGLAYPTNSLTIYNRWGAKIYHRENLSNPEDYWDPSGLPTGTYFFHFTGRGYNGTVERNGAIEVIY